VLRATAGGYATRTGYAKIGSDQCEVVLHSAMCTFVVRPSRALEKARCVSDSRIETREG